MKKIPMRKCVATNISLPKKELLRIVKNKELGVKVDTTGKLNGKGAYLQKSIDALEVAIKRKSLQRALDTEISIEVYDEIRSVING